MVNFKKKEKRECLPTPSLEELLKCLTRLYKLLCVKKYP